jgi:hypothetical protein
MDERSTLHRIEDDLSETWVEDLATHGVESIETYLAKHLAFLTYLDDTATAS